MQHGTNPDPQSTMKTVLVGRRFIESIEFIVTYSSISLLHTLDVYILATLVLAAVKDTCLCLRSEISRCLFSMQARKVLRAELGIEIERKMKHCTRGS